MIGGKQFCHLGSKPKARSYPRTFALTTHTYDLRTHKTKTAQASALQNVKYKLVCLTTKLHTVHHTSEGLITQSVDGVHLGGEEPFQRTLAVKQHPIVVF